MDFPTNTQVLFYCTAEDSGSCTKACMDRHSICENLRMRVDVKLTVFDGAIV